MNCAFASDNTAGLCPEAMAALVAANDDFVTSYGDDALTAQACEAFRRFFEADCDVYFVFNGTAANALALASICSSFHSIIAAEEAHCETDECGAPGFFTHGARNLPVHCPEGKLDPADVARVIAKRNDVHFPRPRALSLSNSTEFGTVYRPEEIRALSTIAHEHGLRVQMDGARFFNALASLGCTGAEATWRAGVDVLCCGGTKLGMSAAEAVVFFDKPLGEEFARRCKQAGQLCSKMRFASAQWLRMLEGDVWRKHAENGNRLARKLAENLALIADAEILYPVDANAVFVRLPAPVKEGLKERGWKFYSFIGGGSRLMCSWATTDEHVDAFTADALACG